MLCHSSTDRVLCLAYVVCFEKFTINAKYINFRLHDRTAQNEDETHNFKTKLIIRQIKMQEKDLLHIQNNIDEEMVKLMEISSSIKYQNIMTTLNDIRIIRKSTLRQTIMKKLNNLYQGNLFLKDKKIRFYFM